jgi:voltage-gated potassium channel
VKIGQWERATGRLLTAAAIVFLAAYAIPIMWPHLPHAVLTGCSIASWATWMLFAVDLVVRFALAPDRLRYLVRHWFDVIVVALPLLRPLRLLRLVPLLRVLNQRATSGLRGRLAIYVGGGASLLAFCGALTVLDAERTNPEANITGFGDAAWWAIVTMTTVGYGDRYPTTGIGRLAAVALMLAGIAVLGVVTATLASWLVEQVKTSEQEQTEELRAQIADLRAKVEALGDESGRAGPS